MYKSNTENVEVYFICYKQEEMNLVESYYDELLDIHYWYFNAYLAYKSWKIKFKDLEIGEIGKMFLTVAASRYLIYQIEEEKFSNDKEYKKIMKDLKKINIELEKITLENSMVLNL